MILVTGFTGNTGSLVVEKLLTKYSPNQIVGITRNTKYKNSFEINVEFTELENEIEIETIFQKYNFDSIIHIANIRYSPFLIKLANKFNIPKIILVHTTGVYSKYRAYSELYEKIEEEILHNSYINTNYIILRPTMIFGNERDHNMHKLIKFLSKYPVFPVFGDGSALLQPVHVEDLSDGIVSALENSNLVNENYVLSGGTVIKYKQVLQLIKNELNKKILFIHIPIKLAIFMAQIYETVIKKPLISVEQVKRIQEDKSYSNQKAKEDLNFEPRSFKNGIINEIKLLREKGLI
ncbi:NAD(P)-dependent oxidoreductase [Alkalihalobacillus sp. AL-G]|uniref:NAD-dependent epimerase/dehydratase family protein n=1 Tax=Alkalihalobacillus sp. AL-G TaxID=2926399 RepID=UPI00272C6850|nr:NAD-dependent epimerase/dehydratase family protein [Alkalihalobacillus sp. AL-G]WLD93006.1 NAD-dependent epimerase/dehydratase family protein [Alkalihalobacillus sp. AL-G]